MTVEYISREGAAALIGISLRMLDKLEAEGRGPERIRFSTRCIRYNAAQVRQWMADNRTRPTVAAEG
jgi:predicted DNA-binding transcriptional regulator AlpA